MKTFRYTLMECPGVDIEIEASYFRIEAGGALVFYNFVQKMPGDSNHRDDVVRAVNARVWRVVE